LFELKYNYTEVTINKQNLYAWDSRQLWWFYESKIYVFFQIMPKPISKKTGMNQTRL